MNTRQVVNVARKLAERSGQRVDDVSVQLDRIDIDGAGLERRQDVSPAARAHDADTLGLLELVPDAGDVVEKVRQRRGGGLEVRDGSSGRRVLLDPQLLERL